MAIFPVRGIQVPLLTAVCSHMSSTCLATDKKQDIYLKKKKKKIAATQEVSFTIYTIRSFKLSCLSSIKI